MGRLSEQLGQAMGQGAAKTFVDPQVLVQQKRLSEAFKDIPENASLQDILTRAGPELLTTPGGAQFLESYMQLQQKQGQAKSMQNYLQRQMGLGEEAQVQPQQQVPGQQPAMDPNSGYMPQQGMPNQQQQQGKPQQATSQGYKTGREPKAPKSKESLYPKRTVAPEPIPLPTPQQRQMKIHQIMADQLAFGNTPDYNAVANTVNQESQMIQQHNQQVEQERQLIREQQDKMVAQNVQRAADSNLFQKPEDRTVFEKFTNEANDAENPNDAYQYARDKFRQFETARTGLTRGLDVPNIAEKIYRKALGTYKEKSEMIKEMQPDLDVFRELGLYDEARNLLTNDFGLGPEDTERALFPLTPEQEKLYNQFMPNPAYKKTEPVMGVGNPPQKELSPKNFDRFYKDLSNLIQQDPQTNLIALRGEMVDGKGYPWQDVSKAIAQMIDEGAFKPDAIQREQYNVIKNPPLPGLTEMFKFFWKGTK